MRDGEAKHFERAELDRKIEADGRIAGDIARHLDDLLTAITLHTELLIVNLDPSGTSIQDAREIRRATLSAVRLTETLRTLSGEHRKSTEPAAGPDAAKPETRLTATGPVLVVEDEPRVRELIRLALERAGHEVMAVAGPHAALAVLHRQPAISLMLVDVVMPEMDGYDLVAEARKLSPGLHVVFTSGFARDTTRHPSGDGFLAKPFTIESLTNIVEHALVGR
jgi:CheY-like chemotaxis protein